MVRNLYEKAGFELHIYARTSYKSGRYQVKVRSFMNRSESVSCDAVITIAGFPQDVEEVYFDEGNMTVHRWCLFRSTQQPASDCRKRFTEGIQRDSMLMHR